MLQCKNDIHFNPKSGTAPVFSPYSFSISQLFKPRFFVIYIYKTVSEFSKGNILVKLQMCLSMKDSFLTLFIV